MGRGKSTKPTGLGKSVEEHPLRDEIRELARNRFSAESIRRLLSYQYQAELEAGDLPPLPAVRTRCDG